MLLSVNINEKSFGDKVLYRDLNFRVQEGEKIALIGRNGTGKSTLFNILVGDDTDFDGEVIAKRGAVLVASRQEHYGHEHKTVLEYVQGDLPDYARLAHILDTYPASMAGSNHKMQQYSDALERFSQLGYFQAEDEIGQLLAEYQLPPDVLHRQLNEISGGQRRMIELIKVQRSRGHVALIDEPTNHMDFVAKAAFIKWLRAAREAVVVITHDRDVLRQVTRIVEIRDGTAHEFGGNYDDYLRVNTSRVSSAVNEYETVQKRIKNLEEAVIRFQRLKERARDPGTIRRFKSQEQAARGELEQLRGQPKPTFWIDQESTATLNNKLAESYDTHKARNIRLQVQGKAAKSHRLLVQASGLSLGYADQPLFSDINFSLHEADRLRLHGRNGAGKTTLVQAILARADEHPYGCRLFYGTLAVQKDIKIGIYEQEMPDQYLQLTLGQAIEQSLEAKGLPVSQQKVKQLLGEYLFDPASDIDMPVQRLSGGQKARFQLIHMLAGDPMLLILDEPTNHLDLPSIEELENALSKYQGAIIYISHDSYFAAKLGGVTITIGQ